MSRFHKLDAAIDEVLAADDAAHVANDQSDTGVSLENPTPQPEDEEDIGTMADTDTPVEQTAEYQAGHAAGLKESNDRMTAVFGSEHFAGREAHAARLLGNAKLTDAEIIAELPNFAKAQALDPEAAREAAEEGGRAEMRDAMAAAGNTDLGADQGTEEKTGRAAADAVWDRAAAKVAPRQQKKG